jgi:hypothetical protein
MITASTVLFQSPGAQATSVGRQTAVLYVVRRSPGHARSLCSRCTGAEHANMWQSRCSMNECRATWVECSTSPTGPGQAPNGHAYVAVTSYDLGPTWESQPGSQPTNLRQPSTLDVLQKPPTHVAQGGRQEQELLGMRISNDVHADQRNSQAYPMVVQRGCRHLRD